MRRKSITVYLAELWEAVLVTLQDTTVQKTILIVVAVHVLAYLCFFGLLPVRYESPEQVSIPVVTSSPAGLQRYSMS